MMNFNADGNPTVTAMYLVDRGPQGRWYRWFDAETNKWGTCGTDMNSALDGKDNDSTFHVVGFFPWIGPLTGPKFNPNKKVADITPEDEIKPTKVAKPAKRMAKAKLVITQVGNTKVGSIVKSNGTVKHPDGTVFYRADRAKWVAVYNQKQEAARPTAEACLNFLKKKYNVDGVVLK